jgi:hypothetical protein
MSTLVLLGVGVSTGFLATIIFEQLRRIVIKHRELTRQKPLEVSDVVEWLRECHKERRSADEEAYDFARQLVIKGRLWTDTPICVEGVTSMDTAVSGEAALITEHAYVYIVIFTYYRDSYLAKIFISILTYVSTIRP